MSKHQLELQAPSDPSAKTATSLNFEALKLGKVSLREAIGASDASIDELRAQAVALYEAGKWDRCLDVLLGLSALGRLSVTEAVLLPRCYDELGDPASAQITARLVEEVLLELDYVVGEAGGGKS